MLELEVLISKLITIDRLTTSAISICEVTSLCHEPWNNSMEMRSLVPELDSFSSLSFLSSAQSSEIFGCLWYCVSK